MLAFDLDGVVADFVAGFTTVAHRLHGSPILTGGAQQEWDFGNILTPEQVNQTWRAIDASPHFWETLETLLTPAEEVQFRQLIQKNHSAFFLTNRKEYTRQQTARWIDSQFGPNITVVHAKNKAEAAVQLGVTTIVEDSPSNIPELQKAGVRVLIRDWPYNKGIDGERVGSMGQAIQIVKSL